MSIQNYFVYIIYITVTSKYVDTKFSAHGEPK